MFKIHENSYTIKRNTLFKKDEQVLQFLHV